MKPGTGIFAKFRDGTERRASVIDRIPRQSEDGGELAQWRYYVHYIGLNRRMDTWVPQSDVRYDAEADAAAKQERAKLEKAAKNATGAGAASAAAAAASAIHFGDGKGAKLSGGGKGKSGGGKEGADVTAAGAGAGSSSSSAQASAAGAGAGPGHHAAHHASSSHGHGHGGHGHHVTIGDDEIMDVDGTILHAKRKADGEMVIENVEPEHETAGLTEASLREHEEVTKVKNVNFLELGQFRMETWYFSPLPKEYWPNFYIDTVSYPPNV